jgi:hypothetical protein
LDDENKDICIYICINKEFLVLLLFGGGMVWCFTPPSTTFQLYIKHEIISKYITTPLPQKQKQTNKNNNKKADKTIRQTGPIVLKITKKIECLL